jgi:hypothetical protein
LVEKFRVLLGSPLAEGVARIVDDSYRLLPIIPGLGRGHGSEHAPVAEIEPPIAAGA